MGFRLVPVSADSILSGTLSGAYTLSGTIQSPNYVPGSTGYIIRGDGTVEFGSGVFRGSVVVGTTGGRRIEIGVVSGSVQMFDSGNAVVVDWSSSAGRFVVYKAGSAQTAYVSLDTTFQSPGLIMQANTAKYVTAGSIAHSDGLGDGGIPTLALGSGRSSGRNQATISLTGQSTTAGTTPSQIQLDATTVLAPSGTAHAAGSVCSPLLTAGTAAVAPNTTVTVASVTVPTVAGRSYKVVGHWHGVIFNTPGTVNNNRATMSLRRNGTNIAGQRIIGEAGMSGTANGGTIPSPPDTPGAGNTVYDLVMFHESGSTAASAAVSASASSPGFVIVEGFA